MKLAKFENAIEHRLRKYSHQSWSRKVRASAVLEHDYWGLAKGAHGPPSFLPEKGRSRIRGIWWLDGHGDSPWLGNRSV